VVKLEKKIEKVHEKGGISEKGRLGQKKKNRIGGERKKKGSTNSKKFRQERNVEGVLGDDLRDILRKKKKCNNLRRKIPN